MNSPQSSPRSISFFYFSGTGNTWWVTNELCKKLREHGWVANMVSIESATFRSSENFDTRISRLIEEADILAVGFPIYGSDCPTPMRKFMEMLPDLKQTPSVNKKVLTYVTQMMFSGDGGYLFHKLLQTKGYSHQWAFHFNMPNNITFVHAVL